MKKYFSMKKEDKAERIKEIEIEMARTQKNKATALHLAFLKARLAKLKTEEKRSKVKKEDDFTLSRAGCARIGMVGLPSVGKSTLLSKLSNVESKVGSYEFTTMKAIGALIKIKNSEIQLIDLPGIIEGASDNKGKGRRVLSFARSCDLVIIMLDATKNLISQMRIIERELYNAGLRINKTKKDIKITKKINGGVQIRYHDKSKVAEELHNRELVVKILKEYRINNCELFIREGTVDDLIDHLEGNRIFLPAIYFINKIDCISLSRLDIIDRYFNYRLPDQLDKLYYLSANKNYNFKNIPEVFWDNLNFIEIFPKKKKIDEPVLLKKNKNRVKDFAEKIHKEWAKEIKRAKVWGSSVKHQPQTVGVDHELEDGDVIKLIK